jgi:hypothetical protein
MGKGGKEERGKGERRKGERGVLIHRKRDDSLFCFALN